MEEIRRAIPSYGVASRTIELLRALAAASGSPGSKYTGSLDADHPLAWATGKDELRFHLSALHRRGLIDFKEVHNGMNYQATLTPEGWLEIEQGGAMSLPRAFVAMSFDVSMLPTWTDGLEPGINAAGYEAHRVDSKPHVDRIDQKIVADIRTSRFVVADVTQQKAGVYFEAGLALGLGKTVVWSVRRDELKNVHFDTRQFAHIVWDTPDDLASQLHDVVVGVLGRGPRNP